eukprot:2575569-Amphidinium_carterae.1
MFDAPCPQYQSVPDISHRDVCSIDVMIVSSIFHSVSSRMVPFRITCDGGDAPKRKTYFPSRGLNSVHPCMPQLRPCPLG